MKRVAAGARSRLLGFLSLRNVQTIKPTTAWIGHYCTYWTVHKKTSERFECAVNLKRHLGKSVPNESVLYIQFSLSPKKFMDFSLYRAKKVSFTSSCSLYMCLYEVFPKPEFYFYIAILHEKVYICKDLTKSELLFIELRIESIRFSLSTFYLDESCRNNSAS